MTPLTPYGVDHALVGLETRLKLPDPNSVVRRIYESRTPEVNVVLVPVAVALMQALEYGDAVKVVECLRWAVTSFPIATQFRVVLENIRDTETLPVQVAFAHVLYNQLQVGGERSVNAT
ncbi:MAG: hypothetical protein Q9163_002666 [Psora crenata]